MPQAVKISTNVISGSINKNGVSFNIEGAGRDFSSLDGGNWYSNVLPDDGRWVIISESQGSGRPAFWLTAGDSNSDLLTTINGLPTRYNQADFANTGSALVYLLNNDYMVLRAVPEQSDADGVRLDLNSNNLSSYPRQGTTWGDVSGEGLDTTLNNSPVFNGGWFEFDGVDDNAQGTDGGKLDFGTGDFTLEAMVNLTSLSSGVYKTPFSRGDTTSGNATWWAFQKTNSNYWGFVVDDNNTKREAIWASTVQERKWYHLMGVRDAGNQLILYVDGVARATQVDNGGSVSQASGYRTFRVGAQQSVLTLSEHFPGKIEKVKVYGSALSADDVKQNYFGGPIVTDGLIWNPNASNLVSYESGSTDVYPLTGSMNGNLINGTGFSSYNGGVWEFDGTNDYINFPANAENIISEVTCEAWFKPTGSPTNGYHVLFQKNGGHSGGAIYGLRALPGGDFWGMVGWGPSSGELLSITGRPSGYNPLTIGQWYHVVCTYDSNYHLKLYVDGIYVGVNTNGTAPLYNNSDVVRIGTGDSRYTNGQIAECRIYNRPLTLEEIQQNYNAQKQKFQF